MLFSRGNQLWQSLVAKICYVPACSKVWHQSCNCNIQANRMLVPLRNQHREGGKQAGGMLVQRTELTSRCGRLADGS